MEATNRLGTYAPKCQITLEFAGREEQKFFTPRRMHNMISEVVRNNPWKNRDGSPNPNLEISTPRFCPEASPDDGPTVRISLEHQNLELSQKQLTAYETWIFGVGSRLAEIVNTNLKGYPQYGRTFWNVSMLYATPVHESDPQSYRMVSRPGDVVRMKCGTIAVVTDFRIICFGHVKELILRPACGIWRHLWLLVTRQLRPTEGEIDLLTKIGEVPIGKD